MKNATIIGITAASILWAGCDKKIRSSGSPASPTIAVQPAVNTGDLPNPSITSSPTLLKDLGAQSSVIVYASRDSNDHWVVTEIWKGSDVASTIGIIIGTQIPYHTPPIPGPPPDGAIVFLPQGCSPATKFSGMSVTAVPASGQEIKAQFKKTLGL